MPTHPSSTSPLPALTRANGTTVAHSDDHGRVIGLAENVQHYGAIPNTGTDSSAAIRAAHAAAAAATPARPVYYPNGQYLYNSATPLILGTNASMLGAGNSSTQVYFQQAGIKLGPGQSQTIKDMYLWTDGPDLVTTNDTVTPVANVLFDNVSLTSTSAGAHLFYAPSTTALIGASFRRCDWVAATNYTAAPIYLLGNSHNVNFWTENTLQCSNSTTATKYFVHIESSNATNTYQNVFRDTDVEGGVNGVFKLLGTTASVIEGCTVYDPPAVIASDIVYIGQPAGGSISANCRVIDVVSNGALAGGVFGVNVLDSQLCSVSHTPLPVKVGQFTKLYDVATPTTVTGTPYSATYQRGPLDAPQGLRLFRKAGAVVDGDFDVIADGILALDTTNSKLYVRIAGAWKSVTVT